MTYRHAHLEHEMFEGERRICPAHGTEYVRWVQSALNQVRALRLPLSGAMDASTRSALRSFQRAEGLPPDGIAGPDSEQALRAELSAAEAEAEAEFGLEEGEAYAFETLDLESAASMPTLRRGSSGSAVSDLQRRLSAAGFNSGAIDGAFGSLTDAAVRAFQGARRLGVDGIVGPNTWSALLGAPPGVPSAPAQGGPRPPISTNFITIASNAVLNPQIESVAKALDEHFRKANLKVTLTSGYRSPQDQLRLIRTQAIQRGLDRLYPSITTATVDNVESWLNAWDDLLHRQKYIINPPVPATSRIVPGKQYSASPHSSGLAFDLSGADLDRIAKVVQGYCQQGGPLRQILVERNNNAVHVGIDGTGSSSCQIT